jgi:ubiquinone/menaquinone biosynthesis C-methylase UbiE
MLVMAQQMPTTPLHYFNLLAKTYEDGTGGCTRELAEHCLPLLPPLTPDSIVLDNACGSGIVTDLILHVTDPKIRPTIHAVDGAPNMVEITRERFMAIENIQVTLMLAEELKFPNDTFTCSITNLGLPFFNDPDQGAKEIFRTLKPGGMALVTGWEDLGYVGVIQTLQRVIHPEKNVYKLPFSSEWLDPHHLKRALEATGFEKVELSATTVHWAAESIDAIASRLLRMFAISIFDSWGEDDKARARTLLPQLLVPTVENFRRSDGTEALGVKMRAIIAVARK